MGLFSRKKEKSVTEPAAPKPKPTHLSFDVAGIGYYKHEVEETVNKDGEYIGKCKLVPEPDNKHDPNAIKVIIKGRPIGYVPADKCLEVRGLIEKAKEIEIELYFDKEENEADGNVTIFW